MARNRLTLVALVAVTAGSALIAAPSALATATAAARPAPAGHWGNARHVPGLDELNTGQDAIVLALSCARPGDCAGGGSYSTKGNDAQMFLIEEKAGKWGTAAPAPKPDPATTDAFFGTLACDAPGDCVAVGFFDMPGAVGRGFVVAERQGTWGSATPVSGTEIPSNVVAASCAPRGGGCVVGGYIFNGPSDSSAQPFVMDRKNGEWGAPQFVDLTDLGGSSGVVREVSCASAGNCAAAGTYLGQSGVTQTFVADEVGGRWGPAQAVTALPAAQPASSFPTALSCGSPGNCAVAGTYTDDHRAEQVYAADEVGGRWGPARQVPGTGTLNVLGIARVGQVSCASAGSCAAVGYYTDSTGSRRAYEAAEKHGTWQPARTLAGAGPLAKGTGSDALTVSCATAGNCVAGGWFVGASDATGQQAFIISEVNGHWGKAQVVPGSSALNKAKIGTTFAVSCAAAGACAAGGSYFASLDSETGFLADESAATRTSIGLSTAQVRLGHEQAGKVAVKVIPRTGGIPGGKVAVKAGSRTVCVITLAGGKGTCRLAAKALKPGRYRLTAVYGGSQTYAGSASGGKTLTVTR